MIVLRKVDKNLISLPRFLSDGNAGMSPATGFAVLANQMINVSTEKTIVKDEILQFSNNHTISVRMREFSEINSELRDIKLLIGNVSFASTRESANVVSSRL